MPKLKMLREIESLMDSILSHRSSDSRLQSRCALWHANLSQTLQHLEFERKGIQLYDRLIEFAEKEQEDQLKLILKGMFAPKILKA